MTPIQQKNDCSLLSSSKMYSINIENEKEITAVYCIYFHVQITIELSTNVQRSLSNTVNYLFTMSIENVKLMLCLGNKTYVEPSLFLTNHYHHG